MHKGWTTTATTTATLALLMAALALNGCTSPRPTGAAPTATTAPAVPAAPATPAPQESPAGPAPVPAAPQATPELAGNQADLAAALAEPSPIHYQIVTVTATGVADKTAYLDQYLAQEGEPGADTLLLLVFVADHAEIRFALGPGFRERGLGVPEMLDLVRNVYQPLKREGNPAGGLAALIRAVNARAAGAPAAGN